MKHEFERPWEESMHPYGKIKLSEKTGHEWRIADRYQRDSWGPRKFKVALCIRCGFFFASNSLPPEDWFGTVYRKMCTEYEMIRQIQEL